MKTENPNLLSPSVLAFVGDAVYGLYVRTALAAVNRPSGELHKLSVTMVNAAAQAKAYSVIAGAFRKGNFRFQARQKFPYLVHTEKRFKRRLSYRHGAGMSFRVALPFGEYRPCGRAFRYNIKKRGIITACASRRKIYNHLTASLGKSLEISRTARSLHIDDCGIGKP